MSALVVLTVLLDKLNVPSFEIALPQGAVLPLNFESETDTAASP